MSEHRFLLGAAIKFKIFRDAQCSSVYPSESASSPVVPAFDRGRKEFGY